MPLPEVHRRVCDWLLEQARRELNERERSSVDERDRISLFRAMLN